MSGSRRPGVAALAVLAAAVAAGCAAHPAAQGSGPTPNAGPRAVAVPGCSARAAAREDADADGLADGCEFALARAFAPELVVDRRDCLWTDAGRLAGGYLFAARPVPGGVRLAYLPAYTRDCGWRGARCWPDGCGAHAGDSEFVAVDVAPAGPGGAGGDVWRPAGVFLSAHCFGRSGGRCRWYRGRALGAFAWAGGGGAGPRVWVARGKHGGYPTRRACDGGHWGYDSCRGNDAVAPFPVVSPAQNVGSRARPRPRAGGCLTAAELALAVPGADPVAVECVWDPARPFRGWQRDAAGAAPSAYARYLVEAAGFSE